MHEMLGLDIGGVIIARIHAESDTSFGSDYLKTPAVIDAFDSIREIVASRFGNNIYLISKCGAEVEDLTRDWLDTHHFFELSSVPRENVRFCRKREQKATICEALGITHFVDDRLEVLGYLKSVENLYLFQPQADEVRRFSQHLDRVCLVHSWSEVREGLVAST